MFKILSNRHHFIPFSTLVVLTGISWSKLYTYLNLDWSANILWIALLPFIIYVKDKQVYSWRYVLPAFASIIFYGIIGAPIFFFFSFCFTVFFIIEAFYGKLNRLAPLVVILITPLTEYLFNIFGFPIRLGLTEAAASLLNKFTSGATSIGNLLSYDNEVFFVDNACMGLRMVIISFLICLLLISHFEKRSKIELKLGFVFVSLVLTIATVILSNFIRIILLIIFKSPPESLSHELIGLSALLFMVIVPLFFIIKFLASRFHFGDQHDVETDLTTTPMRHRYLLSGMILFLLLFFAIKPTQYVDMPRDEVIENMTIDGYEKEILDSNVGKFTSHNTLVYVKPSKGFYRSDHSPVACWRGSGFSIKNESRHEFSGHEVYIANLESEGSILHTAWWYDNGDHQTIDQLDWRWRMLKGEKPFQLINITAANHQDLMNEIIKLLE